MDDGKSIVSGQEPYRNRLRTLERNLANHDGAIALGRSTSSHLFRYSTNGPGPAAAISISDFNHVLGIDASNGVVEVEGAATYETIVTATLASGWLPTVAPELKDITAGGAIVGIGIESSGFRYGFVHDGLLEADVLLPTGRVVTCSDTNEYSDLFAALPNSYGTLGYVLRARIRLVRARPVVRLTIRRMQNVRSYLDAMHEASYDAANDFVEGLILDASNLFLIVGRFEASATRLFDIYGLTPYFKAAMVEGELCLKTEDYIFRYDPDWFWNIPEGPLYSVFRLLAPRAMRHSSFYKRYTNLKSRIAEQVSGGSQPTAAFEPLIQDWEVPWDGAESMVRAALTHVDLEGRPWACLPILPGRTPTVYPVRTQTLYCNLGCYCWTRRRPAAEQFQATRLLDDECFRLGGIKMLYSSTFLDEPQFNERFGGAAYARLKRKYDPDRRRPTLYAKATAGSRT